MAWDATSRSKIVAQLAAVVVLVACQGRSTNVGSSSHPDGPESRAGATSVGNTATGGTSSGNPATGGASTADAGTSTSLPPWRATCGNGDVDPGEACDDANRLDGDGCNAECCVEQDFRLQCFDGWCPQADAPCHCGDGFVAAPEACDDGNTTFGDGCGACRIESGLCGNLTLDADEECDDGNLEALDGCDPGCRVEARSPAAPQFLRIENATDATIYVSATGGSIACENTEEPSEPCRFFPFDCMDDCASVSPMVGCCIDCEAAAPEVYEIGPGDSREFPWDGNVHVRRSGHCGECDCQQSLPIQNGTYEAVVEAYRGYECEPALDCGAPIAGTIYSATPSGAASEHRTKFSIPAGGVEVVVVVE